MPGRKRKFSACARFNLHLSRLTISIFFLFSVAAIAEESQQDKYEKRFHNIMTASSYPIELKNGEMSGEGVDFLIENARRSQFFMVGEQHGTRDIALLSRAIYARLTSMGYSKMALEVGPWSTIFAENLMRSDLKAYEGFMSDEETYLALPFLFFREEGDIAIDAIQADGVQPVLWGLDQEFIAAAPILLPLLSKQAKTIAEHEAVEAARRTAVGMYVGMTDETALTDLRAAFEKGNDPAALELIDAMIISNRIYKPFTGRGGTSYAGNLERENYMKMNFLTHFKKARSNEPIAPKVFLKFGAYHGSRGRSGTNVPALMDFLAEWAVPKVIAASIYIWIAGAACHVTFSRVAKCPVRVTSSIQRMAKPALLQNTSRRTEWRSWISGDCVPMPRE